MDGYQLTSAIRSAERHGQHSAIPIIGFTADAMSEARERCLRAGMNGCLFKPCTLDDVRRVLAEVVQTAQQASPSFDIALLVGDDATLKAQITGQLLRNNRFYLEELHQLLSQSDAAGLLTLSTHIATSAQTVNAAFVLQACDAVKHAEDAERLQAGYQLKNTLEGYVVLLEQQVHE
jgi:two-component system sensor histidine kinase EvgS